jgi:hypothetical protein
LTSETRFNFWLDYSAIWKGRKKIAPKVFHAIPKTGKVFVRFKPKISNKTKKLYLVILFCGPKKMLGDAGNFEESKI